SDAIDRYSRKIVGVHVGSRDRKGAQALWGSLHNHIGAVWNFVHHYNADIAPKLATTTC
ncbi:MAG: hypothetical protein HQK72_03745, partial [Desulfamplus sp.]|nr:hypothetical protein [Desulfamplus sp.]